MVYAETNGSVLTVTEHRVRLHGLYAYMQKRIEEMEEWSKDVKTSLLKDVGGAVLIQTPDYQATAPEPKKAFRKNKRNR